MQTSIARLRDLYEGHAGRAHRFRYGLLVFDISTVVFIIGTSFLPRTRFLEGLDVAIGLVVLADFSARLAISRTRLRDLFRPSLLADILAIACFLAPILGQCASFLLLLRTVRPPRPFPPHTRLCARTPLFPAPV